MLRAARAFLDPELQSGKVTPEQAYVVLEKDVLLSHAFAKEEVERDRDGKPPRQLDASRAEKARDHIDWELPDLFVVDGDPLADDKFGNMD